MKQPSALLGETSLAHKASIPRILAETNNLPPQYLCIAGMYGRNSNRIITVAHGLAQAKNDGLQLALDLQWTAWYNEWFHPRDDIKLNLNCDAKSASKCRCKSVAAGALYFSMVDDPNWKSTWLQDKPGTNPRGLIPTLCTLKPKLWNTTPPSSIVTVHRRWLEGACVQWANEHMVFCGARNDDAVYNFNYTCAYTEADIRRTAGVLPGNKVVLYTDGQKKDYDKTFEVVADSNLSFPQMLVNMARSAKHFGNPMSSVDYVLAHWRDGPTYPLEYFQDLQDQVKALCTPTPTPELEPDNRRGENQKHLVCVNNLAFHSDGLEKGNPRDDLAAAFLHDTFNKHVNQRGIACLPPSCIRTLLRRVLTDALL
jgi:hypothetical protein